MSALFAPTYRAVVISPWQQQRWSNPNLTPALFVVIAKSRRRRDRRSVVECRQCLGLKSREFEENLFPLFLRFVGRLSRR